MAAHTNYRAIFRFSFDGDANSAMRNTVIRRLEDIGFRNTATGIWETKAAPILEIKTLLNDVLDEVASLSVDPESEFHLDHVWFYIDEVKIEETSED